VPQDKKQKMTPHSWLHLLRGKKKPRSVRALALVLPMSLIISTLAFLHLKLLALTLTAAYLETPFTTHWDYQSPTREQKTKDMTDELMNVPFRYYVYDDPIIQRQDLAQKLRAGKSAKPMLYKLYGTKGLAELELIEAMVKDNKFQTKDPEKADFYFIPLSIITLLTQVADSASLYTESFNAVYNSSIFQKTMGHQHILLTQLNRAFQYKDRNVMRQFGLTQHYPRLWNITLIKEHDAHGIAVAVRKGLHKGTDFESFLNQCSHRITQYGFALGLFPPKGSSPRASSVTYEKFQTASNFLFYHSRSTDFFSNSTLIRNRLLKENHADLLPHSSIGYDLPKAEWTAEFQDSKFCLVIRGDNPQSKALVRSIAVGCIPVVVSDLYQFYAQPLGNLFPMTNYAVFIKETEFLEDPIRELLKLASMNDSEIRGKIQGLAFAQRLLFPSHPQSLFVPAVLKAASMAVASHGVD
jgi:hypothetical protein